LKSSKTKILIVGHDYNILDELIGSPIIKYLEKNDCEVITCNNLPPSQTNILSSKISSTLYWKFNKENIGAISYCGDLINGIILLSSFPCGPDSIVNELVIRKIDKPILNLIIDDSDSFTGVETRLESFLDIVKQSV
jgi:predicted nucleotide-binding protein (sugar kinase/HSP70/actin superfamily)